MMVDRPDEHQWQELARIYGRPAFFDISRSVPIPALGTAGLSGSGAVIVLVFNLAGSCIFVRRKGSLDWFFPMGTIRAGEGVVEAARRVASEEAGVAIEPVGAPSCQRVTFPNNGETVQRWHIVVVAETASDVPGPCDITGTAEARLFDVPPAVNDIDTTKWIDELHRAGVRYLRSLDALEGI